MMVGEAKFADHQKGRTMELLDGTLKIDHFLTVTLGIVVLFIGKRLNQVVPAFREFSIPEPVTGGLLMCLLFYALHVFLRAARIWRNQCRVYAGG